MGLEVDVYRIDKKVFQKYGNDIDIHKIYEIINKKEYIETISMRKPFEIWFKIEDVVRCPRIISVGEAIKIKTILEDIIKNFKNLFKDEYNKYFDNYTYHLKKYVDFYCIISNYELSLSYDNQEVLFIDFVR